MNQSNLIPAKKGEVRNPYGKKGKSGQKGKHLKTHIRELLYDESIKVTLNDGSTYEGRPIEGIIYAQMSKALNGDAKAFELLAKYGYPSCPTCDISDSRPINVILDSTYATKPSFRTDN
jgi:hypothetical protein